MTSTLLRCWAVWGAMAPWLAGCALWPDRIVVPQYHNPFPQLYRVAVLPFFNQSAEPTLDGDQVALAYYNELQAIPGFEVMPVGVARQMLEAYIRTIGREPRSGADFQRLARFMGVDAVLVGSVTEYSPYYPPRMGLAVDWYAANPSFHPIPPGYGLPWGRAEEEFIPSTLVQEAEFALARQQLATQTPSLPEDEAEASPVGPVAPVVGRMGGHTTARRSADGTEIDSPVRGGVLDGRGGMTAAPSGATRSEAEDLAAAGLPPDWPDPRGFIPPPPSAVRPAPRPQRAPVISHTRIYHGEDGQLTERLATFYYLRDDARFGGWQAYLERPNDFVRFCCYLHVTETLAARGGAGTARVLWRWPIRRYER